MKATSLVGHSAQLLRIIRKSPQPADILTSGYMRERKYIGASDRRAISAVVFLSLRCLHSSDFIWSAVRDKFKLSFEDQADLGSVLCTLVLSNTWKCSQHLRPLLPDQEALSDKLLEVATQTLCEKALLGPDLASEIVQAVQTMYSDLSSDSHSTEASTDVSDTLRALSLRACLPMWMCERWLGQGRSQEEIEALGLSLLDPAPLSVRANTMLCTRDQLVQELVRKGLQAEPGTLSPHAVLLRERAQLTQLDVFQGGYAEVQDQSSQLVAFALDPEPSWKILDACAGAGGKSLHLAVLQKDKGEIIASDQEPKRMRELHSRARKANLQSIHLKPLLHMSEDERMGLRGSFDAVLIDAPCTGMGTVRRSPMLKWRLSADALYRMSQKQSEILREYAEYVRPGGVLVYVTCSIMQEENQDRVTSFLEQDKRFRPAALKSHMSRLGCSIELDESQYMLQLEPQQYGSDGFFIARMERTQDV